MAQAEQTKSGFWSDATTWADGTVPLSSNGLHVQLDGQFSDLAIGPIGGSAAAPFLTNDIIGVDKGFGLPSLGVGAGGGFAQASFLRTHDIVNVSAVVVGLAQKFVDLRDGGLDVRNDLVNVKSITAGLGSKVEIGHDLGSTAFSLEGSTLILDKPPHASLDNQIALSRTFNGPFPGSGAQTTNLFEFGGVTFDHADLIPPVPGSSTSQIQLSNNGVPVYSLNHVDNASSAVFAGVDHTTGYDVLSVQST
jgi:hypothetical protein